MKTFFLLVTCSATVVRAATGPEGAAQPAADAPLTEIERGPNHRVWGRLEFSTNRLGRIVAATNTAFVELSTGLHYRPEAGLPGEWSESDPRFEITPEGYAVARRGQYRVILAPNINTTNEAPVDLELPDGGGRLASRPLALVFHDRASGSNVLIASLQDCAGQWVSPSVVLFPDAFEGLHAALRFSYSRESFSQDLLLYENPGSPSAWGLSPSSAELQIWTEWFTAPDPRVTALPTDDGEDERVEFPTMALGQGRAYFLNLANHDQTSLPVRKTWKSIAGRRFLIESIRYETAVPLLQRLAAGSAPPSDTMLAQRTAIGHEAFLAQLGRQSAATANLVARITPGQMSEQPALVWEYTLLNTTQTNYVFHGDSTYYIPSTLNLAATTTMEGGAVLKYSNHPSAKIILIGPLVCKTDPYRPVVLTSKDDNTVGETIPGSSGSPTNYNGGTYLQSVETTTNYQNLRLSYAGTAIYGFYGYPSAVWHCQFFRCGTAMLADDDAEIRLHNVLFAQCGTAVSIGGGNSLAGEHVTADQLNKFFNAPNCTGVLSNSILTAVTNIGTNLVLNSCTTNASGNGIYQTVGAAGYYLADNSTNRNAGTTNINPSLLAGLKQRTTYPPIVFSNQVILADLLLSPQAQRDTDTPDLGYHYDPLDYAFGRSVASNATVTLAAGTAVGTFSTSSTYGLGLLAGSGLHTEGTATAPVWIVRSQMAQEQANDAWTNNYGHISIQGNWLGGTAPNVQCRFTKFSAAANSVFHFRDYNQAMPIWFKDCEFFGGKFVVVVASPYLTNNLFARVATAFEDLEYGPVDASVRNCLFYGGTFYLTHLDAGNMVFRDNLFAGTYLVQDGDVDNAYDGYTANTNRLSPTNANDVVADLAFKIGPLGGYYQPDTSSFTNAGSVTNAALVGLYQYTVTTNLVSGAQIKEGSSRVDIGYHYVAVDGNDQPIESDGDGIPDYLEDSNGNGSVNSGETDWNNPVDLGLKVMITRPKIGSQLP